MTEKTLEKQPNAKQLLQPTQEGKEETQDCHFIPELNRIDFFSRVRASTSKVGLQNPIYSPKPTLEAINRAIWI